MSPVPEVPEDVPAAPAWRETALWLLLLALVAACVQYVFPFDAIQLHPAPRSP